MSYKTFKTFYFEVLDGGIDGIFVHDMKNAGQLVHVNRRALEMYGYEKDEALSLDLEHFHSGNPPYTQREARKKYFKAAKGEPQQFEWQAKTKSGKLLWIEVVMKRSSFKEFDYLLSFVKDITERKENQEKIRKSEERLRLILDSVSEAVWEWHLDTGEAYFSPRWYQMLGYTPYELSQTYAVWQSLLHPDDLEKTQKAIQKHLKSGGTFELEFRMRAKDGQWRWILGRGKVIDWDSKGNGSHLVGTHMDITVRKTIEKQTQQLQKLKSIGHLAGGVAHDLNNLLTPLLGYAEMLLEEETESVLKQKRLSAILKAGNSARDLVTQLLAFGRKQALKFRHVNINDVIMDFEPLIRRSIRENIELRIKTTNGLRPIKADIGQMEQVILNLSVNAADAMSGGGHLTIETQMTELDHSYAFAKPGVVPGRYIQLSFSDTGVGMDEKTIEKIFEPFFSTKKEKGTGLGLATVYGIVKQHKGNIWVYSEPGQGTTFKIYLPVSKTKSGARVKQKAQPKISDLNGAETILLAEDNDEVRNIAKEILRKRGYTVLTASNGRQAIETWASYQGRIHLLLTDVVMPKANGKEVFLVIKELDPEIRVLYMSGYTDNVISSQGGLDEGVHFIQKPFRNMDLLIKVRQVLTD